MAPHSSALGWKILWTEEPGRLQSMGSLGVRHNWATSLSLFTFMHWRKKWQPLQCSCLENPRDGGAWWAAVYGVAQSQTRPKRLSSSSSSSSDFSLPLEQSLKSLLNPASSESLERHTILIFESSESTIAQFQALLSIFSLPRRRDLKCQSALVVWFHPVPITTYT